jgi:hypothetical protein
MNKVWPVLITALIAFAVVILAHRVGFLHRLVTGKEHA